MNNEELARSLQCSINKQFGEGTYVVGDPISRGSDGYVYKIHFINDRTPAALKVLEKCQISLEGSLSKKQLKPDPALVRKAKNQIRIHQALKSNYIVRLRNWRQNQMNFFLVLEYCKNGDLGNLIQKHPRGMEMEKIKKIGSELIKGIDTIHKQGVIHMDIKPRNVLMGDHYEVKICDFSHSIRTQEISKAKRGGTRAYLAPEVKDLRKKFCQKADIWSYGCTLFQMATGNVAFKSDDFSEELQKINFTSLPLPLQNLLKRIWRFNPEERLTPSEILNHPFFTGKQLSKDDLIQIPQHIEPKVKRVGLSREHKKISQSAEILSKNPVVQRWKEREDIHKTLNMKKLMKNGNNKEKNSKGPIKIDKATKKLCIHENTEEKKEEGQQKQNISRNSNINPRHHLAVDVKKASTIDELMEHKLKGNKTDGNRLAGVLSPVNLTALPFVNLKRQNENIKISQEGLSQYFVSSGKQIQISPCGTKITMVFGNVCKTYDLEQLPEKYSTIYQRSKQIVKILQNNNRKKNSSHPKIHANDKTQQNQPSRRKISENTQTKFLELDYASPHFALEEASSMKSSFASRQSAHFQAKDNFSLQASNMRINLEVKGEKMGCVNLLLEYDRGRQIFLLGEKIKLSKHDRLVDRQEKIMKAFSLLLGKEAKWVSNEMVIRINQSLDKYMEWMEGAPQIETNRR